MVRSMIDNEENAADVAQTAGDDAADGAHVIRSVAVGFPAIAWPLRRECGRMECVDVNFGEFEGRLLLICWVVCVSFGRRNDDG